MSFEEGSSVTEKQAEPRAAEAAPKAALPVWLAYACAFASFVVAGQTLTARDAAAFEELNVELPAITALHLAYPGPVAAAAVASGLLLLGLTRLTGPRALRALAVGYALFSTLVGLLLTYSNVLVFGRLEQSLGG